MMLENQNSEFTKWIPLYSYENYVFGSQLTELLKAELCRTKSPYAGDDVDLYEQEGWECYESSLYGFTMTTDNGLIWSIECFKSIHFNDFEIIGASLQECSQCLGVRFVDKEGEGVCFHNEGMGIALWIENGVVESVTVSGLEEN